MFCFTHYMFLFSHANACTHTHTRARARTQSRYSAELAMHYVMKDDYNRAKYYTDISMQGFLQVSWFDQLVTIHTYLMC